MHIDTNAWKGSAHSVLDEFLNELQNKSTNIRANVTSHPVNNVLHNINSPESRLANNVCALPSVFMTPQTAGSETNHLEIASTTTKTSHSRSCSTDEVLRAAASGNANDDNFPARASELLDLVERNASAQRRLAHTPTVRTELVGYNNLAHISQFSGEPYTFGNDGRVFLATTESCGPQITPLGSPIQGEHGVTHSHGVNCQLSPFSHAAQQQLSSSAHTVSTRPLHLLDVHTDNIPVNCGAETHCTNCHQYKPLPAPCGLNYDDYNSNMKMGGQGSEKRRASNSFTQQYASIHLQNNLLSSYCGTPTKSRCDETQHPARSEETQSPKHVDALVCVASSVGVTPLARSLKSQHEPVVPETHKRTAAQRLAVKKSRRDISTALSNLKEQCAIGGLILHDVTPNPAYTTAPSKAISLAVAQMKALRGLVKRCQNEVVELQQASKNAM